MERGTSFRPPPQPVASGICTIPGYAQADLLKSTGFQHSPIQGDSQETSTDHERYDQNTQAPRNHSSPIERVIAYMNEVALFMTASDLELPARLQRMSDFHIHRFQETDDPTHVENSLAGATRALFLTPEGHPDLPSRLESLGEAYAARVRLMFNIDDIEQAIKHFSRALSLLPKGRPELPRILGALGASHMDRFMRLGDRTSKDIETAIQLQSRALSLAPESYSELPKILEYLGKSHGIRFQTFGDMSDLEHAIKFHSRALPLVPQGHPRRINILQALATSYGGRFNLLGSRQDMENAVDLLSRLLLVTPEAHPQLPVILEQLGKLYLDFSTRLGELNEVEKAVGHISRAVALTPIGHPALPLRLEFLGESYGMRFQWLGEINDLRSSIEYLTRAVSLTPEGHPDLPRRLIILGKAYGDQSFRLDEPEHMEKAIYFHARAVSLTPENHPEYPHRLGILGGAYGGRAFRLGKPDDLENAILYLSRALALASSFYPSLPRLLEQLGSAHMQRFRQRDELDDIDKAVEYHFQALSHTPDHHAELSARLVTLGISHMVRFKRLSERGDVEKGIKYLSRALSLIPEDRSDMTWLLNDLGYSHINRFEYLHEPIDLDKAIDYISRGLSRIPEGHPGLPTLLQNLGIAYETRFEHFDQLEDLEKAIEYYSQSISLSPNDYPELPWRLTSLGSSYRERFRRLNNLPDLEMAIKYHSRAVSLTPQYHPGLTESLSNLGMSLMDQYLYSGDASHLQDSLSQLRKAAQFTMGASRFRLTAALKWARYAYEHRQQDSIEAYQIAIDLLPQVIWMGATTNQRYQDLQLLSDLAVEAAAVACSGGNYRVALGWLEDARCVVSNQTLLLRSPLDELRVAHPGLADLLQKVTIGLQKASLEPRPTASDPFAPNAPNLEAVARQHHRLATEHDRLLLEIRKLPGYAEFLKPMKVSQLVHAARNGPVVVVICHKIQCSAVAILPGQTEFLPIPLPNFTHEKAKNTHQKILHLLRGKGLRERGIKLGQQSGKKESFQSVLKPLWHEVVKPVLEAMGYLNGVPTDNLPHITWCPTGAASFLPLHAAGDYDHPGSRVFNHVISSYTPTLSALLSCSPSSLDYESHILVVGQETTPGLSPLPGTVREIECIRDHTRNIVHRSELMNAKATREAVLDAMERCDWAHLACHANQNVDDPTMSGFHLHDGTLDLASITGRSFKNKGLAFLSACQTATGDEKLPDEVVHLASGMLVAGYPSVIATMWSVVDDDAPFVADKVYSQLMKVRTVGNGEAGRALHNAVAGLRERVGEKEFLRWVPYIHIGS